MAKEWAKSFYKSKAWQQARSAYISKRVGIDGGMCEVCGERVGYIVHHIVELTPRNISDPAVSLSLDNLMYVCKQCHDEFDGHFQNWRARRRKCNCEFTDDGQILPP